MSAFLLWLLNLLQAISKALQNSIRAAFKDFVKSTIVLIVVILVQGYNFLYNHRAGIAEAAIAAIIAAAFMSYFI